MKAATRRRQIAAGYRKQAAELARKPRWWQFWKRKPDPRLAVALMISADEHDARALELEGTGLGSGFR